MHARELYRSTLALVSSETAGHPLHRLLQPHLLTTRTCTKKWDSTIPKVLASEESNGSPEDEIMWYILNYERAEEAAEDQTEEQAIEADEHWRTRWLLRLEQRE